MAKKPDTRSEDVKRITRSKLYKEIEKDLRDQLEANGTFGKFFDDMISDYMAMYVTRIAGKMAAVQRERRITAVRRLETGRSISSNNAVRLQI